MLREARRACGLTQRDLARRAGVAQSTVARIEAGTLSPTVGRLDLLLRACDGRRLVVELDGAQTRAPLRPVDPNDVRNLLSNLRLTVQQRFDQLHNAIDYRAEVRRSVARRENAQ